MDVLHIVAASKHRTVENPDQASGTSDEWTEFLELDQKMIDFESEIYPEVPIVVETEKDDQAEFADYSVQDNTRPTRKLDKVEGFSSGRTDVLPSSPDTASQLVADALENQGRLLPRHAGGVSEAKLFSSQNDQVVARFVDDVAVSTVSGNAHKSSQNKQLEQAEDSKITFPLEPARVEGTNRNAELGPQDLRRNTIPNNSNQRRTSDNLALSNSQAADGNTLTVRKDFPAFHDRKISEVQSKQTFDEIRTLQLDQGKPTHFGTELLASINKTPTILEALMPTDRVVEQIQMLNSVSNGNKTMANPALITSGQTVRDHGIILQVAQAFDGIEKGSVELRLDPAELGKVRITMAARDGIMFATISAERPETLDLLRRNSDELSSNFEEQGFAGAELDFQQSGQDSLPESQLSDQTFDDASGEASEVAVRPIVTVVSEGLDVKV